MPCLYFASKLTFQPESPIQKAFSLSEINSIEPLYKTLYRFGVVVVEVTMCKNHNIGLYIEKLLIYGHSSVLYRVLFSDTVGKIGVDHYSKLPCL